VITGRAVDGLSRDIASQGGGNVRIARQPRSQRRQGLFPNTYPLWLRNPRSVSAFPISTFPGLNTFIQTISTPLHHRLSKLRGKPRRLGRGCRARAAKLSSASSLLLLNLPADGDWCALTASGEVAWRPQRSTPEPLGRDVPSLLLP
jgi:hypothetical protein